MNDSTGLISAEFEVLAPGEEGDGIEQWIDDDETNDNDACDVEEDESGGDILADQSSSGTSATWAALRVDQLTTLASIISIAC